MSAITRTCPNCKKEYTPELAGDAKGYTNWQSGDLIQVAFPNASPIQREQLITGICSDPCWNEFLSPKGEELE